MTRLTVGLVVVVCLAFGLTSPSLRAVATSTDDVPLVEPLDMDMVGRNDGFGYAAAEIERFFSTPLVIERDASGLDQSLLSPPPPPGVHPRVLFNPEDLADIRRRLGDTACGRLVMGNIRKHLDKQLRDPASPLAVQYEALSAGRLGPPAEGDSNRNGVGFVLLYECFRCLIDDDATGGRKAAAAVATLAGHVETVTLPDGWHGKPMTFPKLVVRSKAVAPNFKAVLVPLRQGQPSPKTIWNDDHTLLTVAWPDQTDTIAFSSHHDGRTRLTVARDGRTVIDWNELAEDSER